MLFLEFISYLGEEISKFYRFDLSERSLESDKRLNLLDALEKFTDLC